VSGIEFGATVPCPYCKGRGELRGSGLTHAELVPFRDRGEKPPSHHPCGYCEAAGYVTAERATLAATGAAQGEPPRADPPAERKP
jgi:hypothetical protein